MSIPWSRLSRSISAAGLALLAAAAGPIGCSIESGSGGMRTSTIVPVSHEPRQPFGGVAGAIDPARRKDLLRQPCDLTKPGAVVWGTANVEVVDTTKFVPQITPEPPAGEPRREKTVLPPHTKPDPVPEGEPNKLVAGRTLEETRTSVEKLFPSIASTGWVPPDPTLAVGPNHVVVTVNQSLAFLTKAGVLQFQVDLGSAGSPGFFEPLGAGGFCFDPKCFYDHYAGRFVVLALETYGSTEAWIDIAISDDSDPNGTWYKYRTDAVITVNTTTYWWDFPGFGYDQNAIYVTGNLFGLNASGYAGGGFRVFTKTPLLTGQAATFATLRDGSLYACMPALHFGANSAAYFTEVDTNTSIKMLAITNPTTAPALVSATVAIPSTPGAAEAPTKNGSPVSSAGITMPMWRNGRLVLVQNSVVGGRNVARWHEFNTGAWPASGAVTRTQSGDIDAGPYLHTVFPAIGINAGNEIGVVVGTTGENQRVAVSVSGRRFTDAAGRIGVPALVKLGDADKGGRWGDYYAVAVDPVDDTTFWTIGEYATAGGGWQNWVSSFKVSDTSVCHPVPDDAGIAQSTAPITLDVLANDWHSSNLTMTIPSFAATTTLGGTVVRSVGTGPGGRDRLIYTPPAATQGYDSFTYTVSDANSQTATAAVTARVFNPATYRTPENPSSTRAGLLASYYVLANPQAMPTFSTLTAYATDLALTLNNASTNGNYSTSGRADNVGAVYTGFVDITSADLYTFYLNSDDGSRMYLGNTLIVDNDGLHGMTEKASTLIGLKPGKHAVKIEFFENGGGAGLIASYSGQNLAKAVIPAARWFSQPPCPDTLAAAPNLTARTVTLTWNPPVGPGAPNVVLSRDGATLGTFPPTTTTFTDSPPLPLIPRHVGYLYTLSAAGGSSCGPLTARAELSSGTIKLYEPFDGYADTAALTGAGWVVTNANTPPENAGWAIADGTGRANPPTFDGTRSRGRFVISDSDAATGTNATGTGQSFDLATPVFSCAGMVSVYLHFDAGVQLNNDGSAVFDIDVSTNGGASWANAARRIAPSRTTPAPAVNIGNADGECGRTTVNLTNFIANQSNVRIRFRHFEPTDDWWAAIDNVLVDDVAVPNGGQTTAMSEELFTLGIPATWTITAQQTGSQTWTAADPCLRSVAANGGVFPRQSGRAVHRLGNVFALLDSACSAALAHDDRLITPAVDCTNTSMVYLHFRSETIPAAGATQQVLVSLDNGATWQPTPVFAYSTGALSVAGEDPVYDVKVLAVPEAVGHGAVRFAFRYANAGNGWWWGIDNVKVTTDPVPCRPDTNHDGAVDSGDFLQFLLDFASGDPAADFDGDGSLDSADFLQFLLDFGAGC